MLMALLPLAGWADGFEEAVVKVGKFTYGDAAIPVVEVIDGIVVDPAKYTVGAGAYKNTACTEAIAFNKMVVGTPYYVKITGNVGTVYEGYETYGTIDVKPAPLEIKVNGGANLTKAYRAADPAANTLVWAAKDGSQLKNGDALNTAVTGTLTYSYAGQPNADVANIDLEFGGLTAANYDISYSALKIEISAKSLTDASVSVTAQQGDVTYTGGVITPVYTVKDGDYTMVVGAAKDYTVSCAGGDVKDVGTYTPTITGANNYTGTITAPTLNTFKVNKATLSIAAKNIKKTYKGAAYDDTALAGEYAVEFYGLLGTDAAPLAGYAAPAFELQGTAKNVGDYIIKVTGGSSKNYTFLQQNEGALAGKLTIEEAELTVTADNKTRGIGQANPEFTYTPTGMVGGEKAKDIITTAPTMTCSATTSSEAGNYDIVISGGAVNSNYKFKYVNGTLTVGKVGITLTILPDSKVYGDADPTYLGAEGTPVKNTNYVVNGLLQGDELTNVHITRVAGENFGKYVMSATFDDVDLDKYTGVSVAPAQFSITARPLTVTVMPQTLANDATEGTLVVSDETVVVEGLKFKDKVTDVVTLAFNTVDPNNVAADKTDIDYPAGIVASLKGGVTNYSFDNVTGRLVFGAGSAALILDAADPTNAETIELYHGKNKNVKIALKRDGRTLGGERNWEAGSWVTMTLPFNITVANLSQKLGYAIVNEINPDRTEISGTGSKFYGKLTMKGAYDKDYLPANKPFLVKISEDFEDIIDGGGNINFGEQTIVAPTTAADLTVDAGKGAKFVGTYAAKTVTKDDDAAIWFMLGNASSWAYIGTKSENSWIIKPFEAYIDMSNAAAAPANMTFYFEDIDGSVTAIKSISADNLGSKQNAEGWYTINGIKLQSAPVVKGIYIHNGKKVVVK